MSKIGAKKLGALVAKHSAPKMPPKKPHGGPPPPSQHDKDEADEEPGEDAEHEAKEHEGGGEHDPEKDKVIAEQQQARIENGNGDDELEGIVGDDEHDPEGETPHWATDEDIWERAEAAVAELPDVEDAQKLLLLAHVYESLGGKVEGKSGGDEDAEEHEPGDEEEEEDEDDEEPEEDL